MMGLPTTILNVGNTVIDVKAAPCAIVDGSVINTDIANGYLLFFDKPASRVTLGTTMADYVVPILGSSISPLVRGGGGVMFLTGISMACVDTVMGTTARIANVSIVLQ